MKNQEKRIKKYFRKSISNFNYYIIVIILSLFSVLTACTPQSKETYLSDYKEFMKNTEKQKTNFTEKDWEIADLKYEKFTGEWKDKYDDEFTWKEELVLAKYTLQYNIFKAGENSTGFYNEYIKEDFKDLKERLKYYKENDMDNDIDFLVEQAKEIGQTATDEINEALKELNSDLKDEIEEAKEKIKE